MIDPDRQKVTRRLEMLSDFEDIAPGIWKSAPFAKAFYHVLKFKDYDHERMLNGYRNLGPKRLATRVDYLLELERAYNWHKSNDLVRFV